MERPDALVLIYDGHCRFCTAQVNRIHRWDLRGKVAFLSLHDPIVQQRYPDLTHAQLMEEMVLIDQSGKHFGGARAFRYLTRIVPGFYPLAPIMHIPFSLPIWSWFYRQVAKHRYRFGKVEDCEGSCEVHFK